MYHITYRLTDIFKLKTKSCRRILMCRCVKKSDHGHGHGHKDEEKNLSAQSLFF